MSAALRAVTWPYERLGEAVELLAREEAGGSAAASPVERPPAEGREDAALLDRWMEASAHCVGAEIEPVEAALSGVAAMVAGAGPAIVRIPGPDEARFLVVRAGGARRVRAVAPDGRTVSVRVEEVRDAMCAPLLAPLSGSVAGMLDGAGLGGRRRRRAERRLMEQLLASRPVGGCWLVRPHAAVVGPGGEARRARVAGRGALVLGLHAAQYALLLASWGVLGYAALGDRLEGGLFAAWLMLLLTGVPLRFLARELGGRLAIDLGLLFRRRLLVGTLRLQPGEIRSQGAGQLLGRALEVEAIEGFAGSGALLALTAVAELVVVVFLLAAGAGGVPHALALVAWVGVVAVAGVLYHRRRGEWTESRLEITNRLVEQMVGHQTTLVQDDPRASGAGEDVALDDYFQRSRRLDSLGARLEGAAARGWLVLGILALAPALASGQHSAGALGLGLGGVLLGARALQSLASGGEQLAGALVAWARLRPLLGAARRPERPGAPRFAARRESPRLRSSASPQPLLDGQGLHFRHEGRARPVIEDLDVRIYPGDRVLLEGPSGSGKSTLGSLLAYSRAPDAGLLLLDGLDPATLGEQGWRRRVVFVPQFHENHVLIGTLAYNALIGRGWPGSAEDVAEAEEVCRGLGLGPLLDRMPAGMMQVVGETGWQLSHGERSRLFVARAVLQDPDLIILDESFAALDPETLTAAVGYLWSRDCALLVVAHP